ncbi:MAG: PGDYG domain-containing protein [Pseudomonadota bacterium]|nr:PGDYG domain-containing protein [Pseudomonadota bacterium]
MLRCEAMTYPDLSEDRAARRARKRAVVVQVEFADKAGILPTQQGPVHFSTGDALLTGSQGERWPVARDTFDVTYTPVAPNRPGKPGPYRKRPLVVWAKPMTEAFDVTLDRDRGTLRGQPGDWLVEYAQADFSVVSAGVFAQTYELLD